MTASTSTYNSATAAHTGGTLSHITGKLHQFFTRWAEKRAMARELQDLYRFSDRELWDIGLSRSDFLSIEQGTYRRD